VLATTVYCRGPPVNQKQQLAKTISLEGAHAGSFGFPRPVAGELIAEGSATGAANSRAMGPIPTPAYFSILNRPEPID
jgi:hypothetical protein